MHVVPLKLRDMEDSGAPLSAGVSCTLSKGI